MRVTTIYLLSALLLTACGGDASSSNQQSSPSAASATDSVDKTQIINPPNPCSMLTAGTAQAELGVRSVTAAAENSQAGEGPAPWKCAFESGNAMISLEVKRSSIGSQRGADSVAAAYSAESGSSYTPASLIGAGVVNLVRQEDTRNSVVSWTGLSWAGESNGELIVEATVATDQKSPEEREEIATAITEIYVGTARQVAAMGG